MSAKSYKATAKLAASGPRIKRARLSIEIEDDAYFNPQQLSEAGLHTRLKHSFSNLTLIL